MSKKLMDFLGGPWPDRIVNLVTVAGLGWLASLIGKIFEMSVAYPVPLGCACAFSFLLGVGVTRLSGYAEAKRRKVELEDARREREAERERQDAEQRHKEAEDEERRVRAFKAMPFECKLVVAGIRSRGHLTLDDEKSDDSPGLAVGRLESMGLCLPDTVPGGMRWTLTKECSSLLDSHPGLITEASAWLSKECDR